MSVRSVIVRLEAEVAGYVAGLGKAAKATDDVVQKTGQASKSIGDQRKAMDSAGKDMAAFGTVTVAALGAAAKAAMGWESAWAGVTKTVDGSPEQMAELEGELRNLAKTLPATHEEIAAVAEAAGQLGVKREDVAAFTRTMVDLGETTNLTADEAATAIAQIANVMGTTGDDIDNFGSTLVALGNAGASTEKEILNMAQRIAGAGKLVGASEGEVLALSNALASVGIEAQLGGGVMSRVMQRMYADIKEGGEGLQNLARVSGLSAKDFATAFETDPVRAVDMMVKGLSRVKDEGGNVVQTMSDLGIKGTEETSVILRLAGAGGLLADSLDLQATAWEENTALINEASKRYETTESKVKIAWNNIKDAAIDAGAVLLPVISGAAENVAGLAQAFGNLPDPVKGAATGLAGVAGTAALAGGGLLVMLPKVKDSIDAFKELNTRADGSSRGLGRVGQAAGIAALAFVGFQIVNGINDSMQEAGVTTEEFTQKLVGLSKNAGSLDEIFKDIGAKEFEGEINSAGEALNKLINQDFNSAIESFGATALGVDNGMAKLAEGLKKADQSIAAAASSGNLELAAKGFKSIADSAEAQGIKLEDVADRFPTYMDALRSMASESNVALTETELLEFAMGKVPPALQAAADGGDKTAQALIGTSEAASSAAAASEAVAEALEEIGMSAEGAITDVDKFTQSLFAAGLRSLSSSDAAVAYQSAIDKMTESVTKNGTTLDINTEAGRANQSAFNDIAKAAITSAEATAKETLATQGSAAAQKGLQASLSQSYKDLVTAAGQLGITGDAADTLARKALGIPKKVPIDTWVNDSASSKLQSIKGQADALDGRVVRMSVVEQYTKMISEIRNPTQADLNGDTFRPRKAAGGAITGPGTGTSDDVPIWASNGEHMLTAQEVQMMGGHDAVYRFRAGVRTGNIQGLAGGGAVGSYTSAAQLSAASQVVPSVSLEGLTVMVTNPFTGEQVRGVVTEVARQEANGAIREADRQSQFRRVGR
ncbi:phage tail tape measure protein [Pseudarthrobacter sp. NPDC092439]|uniref:phage tail tape measure protein n=1 Tax=unclassified Pseudarthrobacter TaxID=2647000 RepID=UPI00380F8656